MHLANKYRGTVEYNLVLEKLKRVAANKEKTYYVAIFEIMKLKPGNYAAKEASHLLGEISDDAHSSGKPMLTAIVLNQATDRPGAGFYELAVKLGKLPADAIADDRDRFWRLEVNRVYSTVW